MMIIKACQGESMSTLSPRESLVDVRQSETSHSYWQNNANVPHWDDSRPVVDAECWKGQILQPGKTFAIQSWRWLESQSPHSQHSSDEEGKLQEES